MKKKNLKSLKLNKSKVANFNQIRGGNPTDAATSDALTLQTLACATNHCTVNCQTEVNITCGSMDVRECATNE